MNWMNGNVVVHGEEDSSCLYLSEFSNKSESWLVRAVTRTWQHIPKHPLTAEQRRNPNKWLRSYRLNNQSLPHEYLPLSLPPSLPPSSFLQLTSRPKKFHIVTPAKHGVNYQDFHKLNFIACFKFIFQTQQTDRDPKSLHRIHTPDSPPPTPKKRKPWGSNEFHRVRNILTTAYDKSKQPTDTWKQKMATALQQSETREEETQEGEHQTLTPMSIKP